MGKQVLEIWSETQLKDKRNQVFGIHGTSIGARVYAPKGLDIQYIRAIVPQGVEDKRVLELLKKS